MDETAKAYPGSARPYMTLEDLVNAPPIPATQEMPAEMQKMLRTDSGVYVRSKSKPKMDFATEEVPGVPGMWRVLGSSHDEELRTTIPGKEQIELKAEGAVVAKEDTARAADSQVESRGIPLE